MNTVLNLVGGRFAEAADGHVLEVLDPSTGEPVGEVPAMTEGDLAAVFDAAAAGAATWRATDSIARGAVLARAARLLRERADEFADLIRRELGKTAAEALGEATKAADFFEYYAGFGRASDGGLLPDAREGTFAMTIREPLGVVVLITPWNDPLLTPARKLAPALISGNAVVLKPSSDTPLIALELAAVLHEAGLPAGVLGTVTGRGSQIGDALLADPRIKAVSFTGSTEVGLALQRNLAGTNIRVQTEMGGKNAAVVLDDADLAIAVPALMQAAFAQAGQRCTATSRLIVQRGVAGRLREALAQGVAAIEVGESMGPVVNRDAQSRITREVDDAVNQGAEVLATSAASRELTERGAFVAPVLLSGSPEQDIWNTEVFGPVLSMLVVDTLDDAIETVNRSAYGLSASIFTASLKSAFTFVQRADAGQISVNQPTSGWDVHEPFGGFKESGSAFKEQGTEAISFYSRVKTAAVRFS